MDECGNLMNLSERPNSLELASNVLKERRRYILIKVTKDDDCEGFKYESMLKNHERWHPILADQLWKLSNPQDRKESTAKKTQPKEVVVIPPSKNKSPFGAKRNSRVTYKAF
uniref:uncharacterized protein C22orf15-like n=1 Tax=Pristiophorus japonicus TaxID=55135 RepID=UPI00398E6B7A